MIRSQLLWKLVFISYSAYLFFQSSVVFFSPNCFSIHHFSFLFYRYYPAGYDVTVVDNLVNANMESLERVKKIANCDSSRIRFGDKIKNFPLYLCVILFISLFFLLSLSLCPTHYFTLPLFLLCLSLSLSPSLSYYSYIFFFFRFYNADICEPKDLELVFSSSPKFDACIHFAGVL